MSLAGSWTASIEPIAEQQRLRRRLAPEVLAEAFGPPQSIKRQDCRSYWLQPAEGPSSRPPSHQAENRPIKATTDQLNWQQAT